MDNQSQTAEIHGPTSLNSTRYQLPTPQLRQPVSAPYLHQGVNFPRTLFIPIKTQREIFIQNPAINGLIQPQAPVAIT